MQKGVLHDQEGIYIYTHIYIYLRAYVIMAGRSARVSALSDKIQGLKFMQRASASAPEVVTEHAAAATTGQTSSKGTKRSGKSGLDKEGRANGSVTARGGSTASVSKVTASANVQKADKDDDGDDDDDNNEEHWVLPDVVKASPARVNDAKERIVAQPGWHEWLGQWHAQNDGETSGMSNGGAARRSFGAWAQDKRKGKRKKTDDDEDDEDDGDVDGEPAYASSWDEDGTDKEVVTSAKKGFIKPGSLTGSRGRKEGKGDVKGHSHDAMGDIRKKGKKDVKRGKEQKDDRDGHQSARRKAAQEKRKDMAYLPKAAKRRKEGFAVPNMKRKDDADQFDASDSGDSLKEF